MSMLVDQAFDPSSAYGFGGNGGVSGFGANSGEQGLSAEVQGLLAALEQDILEWMQSSMQNAQSTPNGQDAPPGSGSSGGSQTNGDGSLDPSSRDAQLLALILQELLQSLQTGDSDASPSSSDGQSGSSSGTLQAIEQLLQMLLSTIEGQGASGDGSGSGDGTSNDFPPSGNGGNGFSGSGSTPQGSGSGQPPVYDTAPREPASGSASGSKTSGVTDDPDNTDNTKDVVASYLSQAGLGKAGIAAVLGNAQQESGFESDVNEGGARGMPNSDVAEDNSDGYGVFQMSGAQKQAFLNYANARNLNPQDVNTQMQYLMQDPQFTNAIQAVRSAEQGGASLDDLTQIFAQQYEKATNMQMGNREQYAQVQQAAGY
jgi:hypothetical protein